MSTAGGFEHPPIYDRLVRERGDIVAEAREVAEQMERHVRQAMGDWTELRPRLRENDGGARAGSAFG
ncbi:hypothetical protein [Streptomyces sp. NPDC017993]|uniref:hypothetical protein n=1 Tax=Streptomyces sp. NPDC017993 TaxID=3365027 RepID=UPI003797BC4B